MVDRVSMGGPCVSACFSIFGLGLSLRVSESQGRLNADNGVLWYSGGMSVFFLRP